MTNNDYALKELARKNIEALKKLDEIAADFTGSVQLIINLNQGGVGDVVLIPSRRIV